MSTNRPSFLWDYDLSAEDVRRVLATGTAVEQRWLIERILMQARWDEIWSYLTPQRIREVLPELKLPLHVKGTWARALELWLDGDCRCKPTLQIERR